MFPEHKSVFWPEGAPTADSIYKLLEESYVLTQGSPMPSSLTSWARVIAMVFQQTTESILCLERLLAETNPSLFDSVMSAAQSCEQQNGVAYRATPSSSPESTDRPRYMTSSYAKSIEEAKQKTSTKSVSWSDLHPETVGLAQRNVSSHYSDDAQPKKNGLQFQQLLSTKNGFSWPES